MDRSMVNVGFHEVRAFVCCPLRLLLSLGLEWRCFAAVQAGVKSADENAPMLCCFSRRFFFSREVLLGGIGSEQSDCCWRGIVLDARSGTKSAVAASALTAKGCAGFDLPATKW
jgi:hypothetical protein